MAKRKRRTEQQERERLHYFSMQHPADLNIKDQAELEKLKQKYGNI